MNDPKTLIISLIGGLVPSLIWLWFWLKEDKQKPEPKGVLAVCFIFGMLSVLLVVQIEKFIQSTVSSNTWQIIGWAAAEEIIKYVVVMLILFRTKFIEEPIDWPIYIITTALGFAAFENMLFLIEPVSLNQATIGLLTGHLRFLGSTLLHTVSSGIVGIFMGLSFFMNKTMRRFYLFIGMILAITLHSIFNFFIIDNNGSNFLRVFAFLWVATIINLLIFEKLRRMSGQN